MTEDKIKKLVKETYKMQQQADELKNKIAENRKLIQEYFDSDANVQANELIVDDIKVTKITSAYVTYNGVKLEKNLKKNGKKNLINSIIKKDYAIINIKAFLELIKLTAITPTQIKSHLRIDRTIDGKAIERLFEKGELTKQDLEGCMDSKIVNSIRFSKLKH